MYLKKYFIPNWTFLLLILSTILVTCFFAVFIGTNSDWNLFLPSNEGNLYHMIYENISSGKLVFRDFFIEYPPLSTYFITFPIFFFKNIDKLLFMKLYIFLTGGWLLIYFLFSKKLLQKLLASKKLTDYMLIFTFINLVILAHVTFARYDLFPGILTTLACLGYISYLKTNKTLSLILSTILIALAFTVKIYPIVIAPLVCLIEIYNKRFLKLFLALLLFILVCSLSLLFIIPGRENFNKFLDYQGDRDLQIESTYASIWLGGEKLGLINKSNIETQNGALEINNPSAKKIGKYILPFVAATLVAIYIYFGYILYKFKNISETTLAKLFALFATISVLIFTIFNKVFSPQYMVWLITLIPLFTIFDLTKYKKYFTGFGIIILIVSTLTFIIYPVLYGDLVQKQFYAVGILLVRNILLIFSLFWLLNWVNFIKKEAIED